MKKSEKKRSEELLLKDQVVIVTGAAKGIGQGIAIEMAREGANIVIADIDEEGARITGELVRQFGRKALVCSTDVSNEEHNNRLVDIVLNQFGKIDILANNAGINAEGGILEISIEGALSVLNTNLVGPFLLTRRVAKEMVKNQIRGSILFTTSVHGHMTYLHPAYTTSKAALEMFVRDIALELAEYGIRVNAVAPGAIVIRGEENRTHTYVPLGYSGTPMDIANAMIFLASEKGSYITGQTLTVDGGFSLANTYYWIKRGIL